MNTQSKSADGQSPHVSLPTSERLIPQREVDEIETAAFLRGQASGKKYAHMWRDQCVAYEDEQEKALEALRRGLQFMNFVGHVGYYDTEAKDKIEAAIKLLQGQST